jgi:isopentenyldiphosphate isomerase
MQLGRQTGSVINHLMSSSSKLPQVGKGMTELLWTDRHAYQVMSVSNDFKNIIVQRCDARRTDNLGMTDSGQQYDYSCLHPYQYKLTFRNKIWKWVIDEIVYQEKDTAFNAANFSENGDLKYIPGITTIQTSYKKANVVFGIQQEYEDPSF